MVKRQIVEWEVPGSNLLYILTSIWVLLTQNAGWNSHFQRFLWKKLKKSKKFATKFCKENIFLRLHQNACQLFYSPRNELFSLKTLIFAVFPLFASKSSENLQKEEKWQIAYFDRLHSLISLSKYTIAKDAKMMKRVILTCTEAVCWSKYTTNYICWWHFVISYSL